MKQISGGVTAAKGFQAAGCAAGIKKNGKDDMALIFCEKPCTVAGTFTTNRVKAAPVVWDREFVIKKKPAQAVVINAGVANACTGDEGMEVCRRTAEEAGRVLSIDPDSVLVASTGVIGAQIPLDKICGGIGILAGKLADDEAGGLDAARAMMTTDTVSKEAAVSVAFSDGTEAVIGGCCKGSGMIHPNMCTMLGFVTTDAAISQEMLQKALSSVIPDTFNMVSVDGDTSTNDTCLLLSSGLAGNAPVAEENSDYELFREGLLDVCTRLAKMMAKDGEGATCLFECEIRGAKTKQDARILARAVVSSTLTKAAIAGHDANWGRILCAMGYSGADFDPGRTDLTLTSSAGSVLTFKDGAPVSVDEELATKILSQDEIRCIAELHEGSECASAWGCDLTHEYVNINADYRS